MQKDELYDYIIIGSGFGGSVSAMRLAEKGYKVLVLEKGKEYKAKDFPKSNWNIKKFLWAPLFKCFGIQGIKFFKEVLILHGVGVGGGSLVYANTLMYPPKTFFENKVWSHLQDWKHILDPFYSQAKFMLGASENPYLNKEDEILKKLAQEDNREKEYTSVDVGVYFGDTDKEIDPYFNGHGPLRSGCTACAGCMIGCQYNAKNTLDKNYLFFAKKFGAIIKAETEVDKIEVINKEYIITAKGSTKYFSKNMKFRTKGVIFSAGVLGSMKLLLKQKYHYKTLPNISETIGNHVKTNSESLCGVTSPKEKLNHGLAITSLYNPTSNTHVEITKYPDGSNLMKYLATVASKPGRWPWSRAVSVITKILKDPWKSTYPWRTDKWANRTIIFLVMQSLENSMKLTFSKWPIFRLHFSNTGNNKVPSYIEDGQQLMERYSKKVNGVTQNSLTETLFNMSSTAHILGGAPIGDDSKNSVVNKNLKVHEYNNMYIIDGSIIPCNIGVNPSLTITAMAEYAMSKIQRKTDEHDFNKMMS